MKNTWENIQKQIQFLVREVEQNILEVIIDESRSRFFVYNNFESSYRGTGTSVEFDSGQMLEITEFLEIVRSDIKSVSFKQAFERFITMNEFVQIKLKDFRWLSYSR